MSSHLLPKGLIQNLTKVLLRDRYSSHIFSSIGQHDVEINLVHSYSPPLDQSRFRRYGGERGAIFNFY